MPSWWGKSSSKQAKKKSSKESIIEVLHRKFRIPSDGKVSSSRHCNDTVSEKGSQSPAESRSPSPSKQVLRCQSFAERPLAQPLPLPIWNPASVNRTDSGINLSTPRSKKGSEPSASLLPRPAHSKLSPTDLDNDLAIASVSSESSIESDDPAQPHQRSPHNTNADNLSGTTGVSLSRGVILNDQPANNSIISPRDSKKPVKPLPKRRPLGSHVPNLQVPYNGAFCSAPDSSRSSPSRSPLRAFASEQVVNSFWPGKQFSDVTLGSGQCSSPNSGQNSGHNSIVVVDASAPLFWQQSRGSPEYSPVPSPRMRSPSPGSRIQSGTVTPTHPRAGGLAHDSHSSWHDDVKQQSHRLPLPPVAVSGHVPYSHSNSTATSPSVPRSPSRAENPGTPGSRWKKGKLLGRGTFGHVYVGFNSESGDMCAMKEVTLFSDDAKSKESAKQLMQEVTLLSRLRHPNIVQYYGSETVGDKLYIYLEYVSGGSIYKLLQDYGQFGELAIRSYTNQILSGLAYLHAKNTVHRDIKGANILVDPNGRVKLADFGMAKHITGQSCPLSFKGSPYWMAPEVIKNSSGANLAVDIWSLGCTVLEMATTKPPWSQYEGVAAMFKIGNSRELPAIPDNLPQDGKDFVYQCLQRNPNQRPTAAQLLDHPFVKYAAPLERPILSTKHSESSPALGTGQARNFSALDSDRLAVHSSRVSNTHSHYSEIPISRNLSCPVSPIGSPLLHSSRSPQHMNGRMSPSPISSPRNASGASTPLTGGSGAIPFNHSKQPMNLHEGVIGNGPKSLNSLYISGPSYHDSGLDIFRGTQPGSHAFAELLAGDNEAPGVRFAAPAHAEYDGQSVLADRVSRQLLRDDFPISPTLDLNAGSTLPGRTHCI